LQLSYDDEEDSVGCGGADAVYGGTNQYVGRSDIY
jgi:hypothetical protein